ncbi:hypothetical protein ACFVIM_25675 [Streptomyces sp. NPDC057638]|uniref:hypothetical protein n=1 Tax=Streptomyces sp. NPDC057638 TaxID=3346190 RepID=UPI0036968DCA
MRRVLGARRAGTALLGGALLLAAIAGCGIRPTQVPVDAGPAPSRMPCDATEDGPAGTGPRDITVQVYLLCAAQLRTVYRTAVLPEATGVDSSVQVARALLAELREEPTAAETEAGFSTQVRGPMGIEGPRDGDPAGTLRLTRMPDELAPRALAQIVCTLAKSRAVPSAETVLLGGPGAYPPKSYGCPQRTMERPQEPVPTHAVTAPSPHPSEAPWGP